MEITTPHDLLCILSVIQKMYEKKSLIIYSSKYPLKKNFLEQLQREFPGAPKLWIDVAFTDWISGVDLYINTTLNYDIHVPRNTRFSINFPHTITSKTKYDVFSPAIERVSDTIITGALYEKDLLRYCKDHNIKKIPRIHRLGGPKSDKLFQKPGDRTDFLNKLGLDPSLPTIFYGPTYNKNASIFSWLKDILDLPEKHHVNLIIKVHPGAYMDPKNIKSSGGVNWKEFFEKDNLSKKRIYNVIEQDSTEFIMASDIGIGDISTLWIEYYFLRKQIIFLDIPEFFKDHEMNSLGDFRGKYGYLVKTPEELNRIVSGMISGDVQKKQVYDIDDALLFNKGHATEETVKKIDELLVKKI
ncbi:CDP-glycerol glycerophosphotransferase family protein [Candidatus Giovannonibacteria bacterium]|nr:CDP-glycerol glycerophosphotransferase family protein [Candidatus Giovannonibacteria bacterium]